MATEPEPRDDVGRAELAWHPAARVAFRFVALYLVLYNLPFPLGAVPGTEFLARPWMALWEAVVPWVGRDVLHLREPVTILPAGSGDTTWNYVQVLCFAVVAAIGTAVWSAFDRRRSHERLHVWLRVHVRLTLGVVMIGYGAYKVIKSQFAYPSLDRLAQPFGDASPMGLLWTFMGYSDAYNVFTGLGELVGGALLFFRRTTTLGALLLIAVLSNVVLLNFAFDVPVKLFSTHLLAMAVFLTLPDVRRLVAVLVLNRTAEPAALPRLFASRRANRAADAVKVAFLALTLFITLRGSAQQRATFGDGAPPPPLYGLYDVEEFVRAGEVVAPAPQDETRWRRLTVGRTGLAIVRGMPAAHRVNFRLRVDQAAGTIRLMSQADTTLAHVLRYATAADPLTGEERLTLWGDYGGAPIRVTLLRRDETDFLLPTRGFRWVNETPFNR